MKKSIIAEFNEATQVIWLDRYQVTPPSQTPKAD